MLHCSNRLLQISRRVCRSKQCLLICRISKIAILYHAWIFSYDVLVTNNQAPFLMKNTINYLRTHRKNTHITQYDIAALLRVQDNSIISRCEKGTRSPSLEMILVYYLLFDIPILALFSNHVEVIKEQLLVEIPKLIRVIEDEGLTPKAQARIRFLNEAVIRLTNPQAHEE